MTNIFSSIGELNGVGPKTVASFATLGINTIYDLIYYFPFKYDELTQLPLDQIMDGQKVVLKGQIVTDPVVARFGYRKTRLSFKLKIDHDVIMVSFFNQPWLQKQLELGQEIAVYGKYNEPKQSLGGMKLIAIKDEQNEMAPIYPKNRFVKQKKLVELIDQVLNDDLNEVGETVPLFLREKYRLLNEQQMISWMHHPKDGIQAHTARRSAAFREFFIFQMQLAMMQQNDKIGHKPVKNYSKNYLQQLISSLPFALSNAQNKVVVEILKDLNSTKLMNRLLEGDVGSGKTVVAAIAIFAAITAGDQVAFMVPTEILAQQHFQSLVKMLSQFGINIGLLTGSTSSKMRKSLLEQLENGQINLLIGTHALFQDDVKFHKLGLVIIDEQHRFGVNQRQKLRQKGENVDFLAMTATPIPRTLALTVYGNMDVSIIDELPDGRKPIVSKFFNNSQLRQVTAKMKEQLEQGFQVYVVTPLISESEQLDLQNAEAIYQKMYDYFGDEYHVALLHGQKKNDEKDQIMQDFVNHKTDILVTTSVIEVGVDVKNANMMVIFDADRFGLSQLHQLRGRIGRGQTTSYAAFIADPKNDVAKKRMELITATTDGFKLAQEDLKLRGQGDLFGKKQSGVPEFQVGDVVNDYQILIEAKKSADEVLERDRSLSLPEHKYLKQVLEYNNQNVAD